MNRSLFFRTLVSRIGQSSLRRISSLVALGLILLASCDLPSFSGKPTPIAFQAVTTVPASPQEQAATSPEETTAPEKKPSTPTTAPKNGLNPLPDRTSDFDPEKPAGLIVFTSLSPGPFAIVDLGTNGSEPPERRLWGISPDGKRAGLLSPAGQGDTALFTPRNEQEPAKYIANGFNLRHPALEPVTLPEDCEQAGINICSEFIFGPEGRTLAYYTGKGICGQNLTLVDLIFNQTINTWSNVHWYEFFSDGSLVLSLDDCSGDPRTIYLYIPNKDTQAGLGQEGDTFWNPTQQAALLQVRGPFAALSGLWGYNLQTSRVFLWMEREQRVIDDSPIWLADGRHFVYQHRPIQYFANSETAVLEGPRQIVLMDAWSRDQRLLAYDGRFDYHLCSSTGAPCEQRYGDWLKIRRTPFRTARVSLDESDSPEVSCALYGLNCQEPAEEMALNWKTGEMLPWSEIELVQEEPTLAFPSPDLSTQPIYSDPGGVYAFYTDSGGRTLWYVPAQGDPVLWVAEGENFVYLP